MTRSKGVYPVIQQTNPNRIQNYVTEKIRSNPVQHRPIPSRHWILLTATSRLPIQSRSNRFASHLPLNLWLKQNFSFSPSTPSAALSPSVSILPIDLAVSTARRLPVDIPRQTELTGAEMTKNQSSVNNQIAYRS